MSAATPAQDHFTVVTLPAYGAAATLEQTFRAIPAASADHLLLVDDASTDGTVDIARRLGIDVRVHDRNRGYGANQKTCYREALDLGATTVVLLHPDYQYDPGAVPALVAPILAGTADFTFGSRFACTGDPRAGGMPGYRYWGNRLTTLLENTLLRTHFTALIVGYRVPPNPPSLGGVREGDSGTERTGGERGLAQGALSEKSRVRAGRLAEQRTFGLKAPAA